MPRNTTLFLIIGFFVLTVLFSATRGVMAADQNTIPEHPWITEAQDADSPQKAVQNIVTHYNEPGTVGTNFDGGLDWNVPVGEIWLLATDWGMPVPQGAISLNSTGGYGAWLVTGPWSGRVNNGVGVRLEIQAPVETHKLYLPQISASGPQPTPTPQPLDGGDG